MTYQVVDTTEWGFDRLQPYTRDVTAAMKKLADKFPDDTTLRALHQECIDGSQRLWLVLNGEGGFVSFCMTQTRTVEATGRKIVTLTNMAGEDMNGCAEAMCEAIHTWCDEIGADLTAAMGSRAWMRALKRHGYEEYAVIMRRRTNNYERAA